MIASMSPPSLSRAAKSIRQSVFARLAPHIAARRAAGEILIPLQIGDTYRLPVAEAFAAATATEDDISLYGAITGMPALLGVLADHRRTAGLAAARSADHVHVGCGCTHALFCAARAVLDPGDEVLVASPYWPLVPGLLRAAGAVPVEVPLSQAMVRGEVDLEASLNAHRTERTRAVYFISPNNPDGAVWSAESLATLADYAQRHDFWVIADEVYADYVYEGAHHHIADLPGMEERTISAFSLSKSHGVAGARVGYVVASPQVVAACRRISNHTLYNVPESMQRVALAAVQHGEDWIAEARVAYRSARDACIAALDEANIRHTGAHGGSFIFADLSPQLAGRSLQGLLEASIAEGVLVAPGGAMGEGYERHVRICFTGVPEAEVVDGVKRLARAAASF